LKNMNNDKKLTLRIRELALIKALG